MSTQPTRMTSAVEIIQDYNSRPPLTPFTKQELAKLAAINDLDERDDAMMAMHRQKEAAATPANPAT